MKRANAFLCIATIYLAISCSPNNSQNRPNQVMLKGTIPAANLTKATSGTLLSQAKKVLVFSGAAYSLADVSNGIFTAYADAGTATALVFLDANNKYIGHLCAGGLSMLPLTNLKDGDSTVIDLSTLTLNGNDVLPTHNPLGDEIGLSPDEITMYHEISGYYKALAKNIDADNNGIPDILNNTNIGITTVYSIYFGNAGINDIAPQPVDTSTYQVNYSLRIEAGKSLKSLGDNTITLAGPKDSASSDIVLDRFSFAPDGFMSSFRRMNPAFPYIWLPFMNGIYTLTLQGTHVYTLSYSGVNANSFLIVAIPTLHTNADGKLESITFAYRFPDGTPITNPENVLTGIQVHIWDSTLTTQLYEAGTLYDRVNPTTNFSGFTPAIPVDISRSKPGRVGVCYTDLLGNQYDCSWGNDQ